MTLTRYKYYQDKLFLCDLKSKVSNNVDYECREHLLTSFVKQHTDTIIFLKSPIFTLFSKIIL